jgi:hypothetical protein
VATIPPPKGESAVVAQIAAQMARYTRSISVAESERHSFQEQWYGRERNLLRQLMMQGRTSSRKSNKDAERAEATGETSARSATPTSSAQAPIPANQVPGEAKEKNPQEPVTSGAESAPSTPSAGQAMTVRPSLTVAKDKESLGQRKANP